MREQDVIALLGITDQVVEPRHRVLAEKIARDPSIPLWKKAHLVGAAFTDIDLLKLKSKHRHRIHNQAAQVNAILGKYELSGFEDYQKVSEADLQLVVTHCLAMGFKR